MPISKSNDFVQCVVLLSRSLVVRIWLHESSCSALLLGNTCVGCEITTEIPMLLVGIIRLENRFCTNKRVGIGGGGWA